MPALAALLHLQAGGAGPMAAVAVTGAPGAGKDAVVAGERLRHGVESRAEGAISVPAGPLALPIPSPLPPSPYLPQASRGW